MSPEGAKGPADGCDARWPTAIAKHSVLTSAQQVSHQACDGRATSQAQIDVDDRATVSRRYPGQMCVREDQAARFQAWFRQRQIEVQHLTSGYVVTVDYVACRDMRGTVPGYLDLNAAQRSAVMVMRQDRQAIAVPCPVDRYKRTLVEQMHWIEAVLDDVLDENIEIFRPELVGQIGTGELKNGEGGG